MNSAPALIAVSACPVVSTVPAPRRICGKRARIRAMASAAAAVRNVISAQGNPPSSSASASGKASSSFGMLTTGTIPISRARSTMLMDTPAECRHSCVNPPPARRGAAHTFLPVRMIRLAVIEQQLLAWFDVTQSEEEEVAVDGLAVAVGFTGMIDELRAVAATAPVDRPIRVDAADVDASFVLQTARDFVTGDYFAGVFGYLAPLFEGGCGETSQAVDPGRPDFNARGETCLLYSVSAQNTDNGR